MASSVGRIALGVVGAIIGAPFGLSAVGFALGSAIGGTIFGPEVSGPDIEGPRIGDTDVTASSLGRMIPDQYGVTRSAGNVIWSAGLKEIKTVTQNSGGGKGGAPDPGSQTTYEYFGNFATAFGRGPARMLLKIYADGKLIYDITGSSESVQNDKYKVRFYDGSWTQLPDPLIEESINRRLQGLPDVNEGSGPQSTYQTIDDLIQETITQEGYGNTRATIYRTYLDQLKTAAIAGGGTPLDYNFTPAYRGIVYIVFEDMPLKDFGNRLPNITAEIAWGSDDLVAANVGDPVLSAITVMSPPLAVPETGLGMGPLGLKFVGQTGNQLRLFDRNSNAEILRATNDDVNRIIGVNGNGDVIVQATNNSGDLIAKVLPNSLRLTGISTYGTYFGIDFYRTHPTVVADCTFGVTPGGTRYPGTFLGINTTGRIFLLGTEGSSVTVMAGLGITETETWIGEADNQTQIITRSGGVETSLEGEGPLTRGPEDTVLALVDDGADWYLKRIKVRYPAAPEGYTDIGQGDGFDAGGSPSFGGGGGDPSNGDPESPDGGYGDSGSSGPSI